MPEPSTPRSLIRAKFVGVEPGALGHMLLQERSHLAGLAAGDDDGANLPAAGPQPPHHGLVGRPAASLAVVSSPNVGVVDLQRAPQLSQEAVPPEHLAKEGQQAPGNPLADLQLPRQGVRGDPDLEERQRQDPLGQGEPRALQSGAGQQGEVVPAGLAPVVAPASVVHAPDLVTLATGTSDTIRPF